jgi:hypothetical protein
MLVSGHQEVFHSCLSGGSFKKAREIADFIASAIEAIGSEYIVQIVWMAQLGMPLNF